MKARATEATPRLEKNASTTKPIATALNTTLVASLVLFCASPQQALAQNEPSDTGNTPDMHTADLSQIASATRSGTAIIKAQLEHATSINELKSVASSAQQNADEAKEALNSNGAPYIQAKATQDAAQAAYDSAKTNADEARQAALDELSAQTNAAMKKADEAQVALDAANAELQTAKNDAAAKANSYDAAKRAAAEAQAALNAAKQAASDATPEALAAAKAAVDQASSALQKAQTDAANAQTSLNEAQKHADEAVAANTAAQTALAAAQQAKNAADGQVASAQAAFDSAQKALDQAKQGETGYGEAQARVDQAKVALDSATSAAQAATDELATAQAASNAANNELAQATDELSEKEAADATAQQALSNANDTAAVAKTEFEKAQTAYPNAQANQQKTQQALEAAQSAKKEADEALSNAQQAKEDADAAVAAAQKAYDDAQKAADGAITEADLKGTEFIDWMVGNTGWTQQQIDNLGMGYCNANDPKDAFSMANIRAAVQQMRAVNKWRTDRGLNELLVSYQKAGVVAMLNADYSDVELEHSPNWTICNAENAAWNYGVDADFVGQWAGEKADFDDICKELGYEQQSEATAFQFYLSHRNEIDKQAGKRVVGHYINLCTTSSNAMGFGICAKGTNSGWTTAVLDLDWINTANVKPGTLTVDWYETKIDEFVKEKTSALNCTPELGLRK